MSVLENTKPERVFYYFEEISKIPRPSYHEKAISDYLVSFAKEHGLEYIQDELYNVIIIKPATPGYEDKPAIVLQGHMDMVCEKTSDCDKDMEKEGLELVLEGDILSARGTTLGGDDGIAVAYALALLEDDTLRHPRLEVVLTVCEEVGLEGANGIDVSSLQGRIFLNLDSEMEGRCLAGCAGGSTVELSLPVKRQATPSDGAGTYRITVSGGKGGHSGDEIDKGRGNATILLARVLRAIDQSLSWSLVDIAGGGKVNAITREATAIIMTADFDKLEEIVREQCEAIQREYAATDAGLLVTCETAIAETEPMTAESSRQALLLISSLPNGIIRMSRNIEGLVETSLNLGITKTSGDELFLSYCLRSAVGSACRELQERVLFIAQALGAGTKVSGEYPAWEYVKTSPLRDKMSAIYRDMTGKELLVRAIHAGVECGLFAEKMPGLDAVSFGPDLWDIHTPDEHLSVSSVARVYEFVRRIIEEL